MIKTNFKKFFILTICVISLITFSACAKKNNEESTIKYKSINDLHNIKMGLETGSAIEGFLKENYPDCEIVYFSSSADRALSVEEKKVTAYWADGPKIKAIAREKDDLYYLSDDRFVSALGYAFSDNEKGHKLKKQMDDFLDELETSGELDVLKTKWVDNLALEIVNDQDLENINGELNISLDCLNQPFTFYFNGGYGGLEYDILVRFCRKYGYSMNVSITNLEGTIAAVSSEKSDMGVSALTITEERKKSILFSDPFYICDAKCLLLKENLDVEIDTLDYLANKNIGVVTGTMHDEVVKKYLPNANIVYFPNMADMLMGISLGKVDAGVNDESIITLGIREYENLYIAKNADVQDYAFMLAKTEFGQKVVNGLNEYIIKLKENGDLEKLRDFWLSDTQSKEYDYEALTGENGTIRVAAYQDAIPFSYMSNNKIDGLEIDILYNFAKEYGYKLEIEPLSLESTIAYLSTGKSDLATGGFVVTEERKQNFYFSDSYYVGGNSFVMANIESEHSKSIYDELVDNFKKTFIVENRYLLFVDGLKSTLLITLASVFFGTMFGTLMFLVFRMNNKIINSCLDIYSWVIRSMPTVVLLMVLYYIIFGKISISGTSVSIIAFSSVFALSVLAIFKTCFMAIDKGQYEASYALGYNKYETFFKIILPQMGPMFIPSFSSEIISLIKSTSIVGYITVQDLTKVGDIVRSRTFDAFFPLIATTIIYFVIMFLFTILLRKLANLVDPKTRTKEEIMKGVKTHD